MSPTRSRSSERCRRSTRSSPSASSTKPAASSSCCTHRSVAASTARFGLALRKRFCVSFDFELQAAATDDGVVISLGEQHSFPLPAVFGMVRPQTFEGDLVQAALASPMFTNRWRWNATRALALARTQGGKRVPIALQRMRAEDLLAAVFPAQLACGDNGPRLRRSARPSAGERNARQLSPRGDGRRRSCGACSRRSRRAIRALAVETPAPSPMSHEILNANPYAFLDDAPLEERRARAVSLRRTDPDLASGLGSLDPAAIDEVRRQAWPEARDADEVHDALLTLCWLPERDAAGWQCAARGADRAGRASRGERRARSAPSSPPSACNGCGPRSRLRRSRPRLLRSRRSASARGRRRGFRGDRARLDERDSAR